MAKTAVVVALEIGEQQNHRRYGERRVNEGVDDYAFKVPGKDRGDEDGPGISGDRGVVYLGYEGN